jgi:adenine/guanine phosphoribosyltransferase-like PRPP-binding protein
MACECAIGEFCKKRNAPVSAGLKWSCEKGALDVEEWDVSKPSRGLGDTIAKVTNFLGIPSCGGCKKRQKALNKSVPFRKTKRNTSNVRKSGPFVPGPGLPRFITLEQYGSDIRRLAQIVPNDVDIVAGVSRSGLYPATMIAMMLHKPMVVVNQQTGNITIPGNGWRLANQQRHIEPKGNRVLVIDDTTMTGGSQSLIRKAVAGKYGQVTYATVYCNPNANLGMPDIHAVSLPWPHLLEWNLFNSILSPSMATDFDGILCRDCTREEDDDGERYLNFIRTANPLYLMRKSVIPLIVTARLEKYREETVAWLGRHGMKAEKIIMGPWSNNQERSRVDLGAWKGEHFMAWSKGRGGVKPLIFAESEERQAKRVAKVSGGLVVCPAAGRCFRGE